MVNEDRIKSAKETLEKEEPSRLTDPDASPEVPEMGDQGSCCLTSIGPHDPRKSNTAAPKAQTAALTEADTMRASEGQRQPGAQNQQVSMHRKSPKLRAKIALIPEMTPSQRRAERSNPFSTKTKTADSRSPSALMPETTKAIKDTLVDNITRSYLHTWAIEGRNLESLRRILQDTTLDIDMRMESGSRDVERWISGKIVEWLEEGQSEGRWEVKRLEEILTPRTEKGPVEEGEIYGGGRGGESPDLGHPLSPGESESEGDDSDETIVEEGPYALTSFTRREEDAERNSVACRRLEFIFGADRPSNTPTFRPQSQLQVAIPPPANAPLRGQGHLSRMISAEEFAFLEGILFRLIFTNPRICAVESLRMAGRRVLLSLAPSLEERRRCYGRLRAVGLGEREVTGFQARLDEEKPGDIGNVQGSGKSVKAGREGSGEEKGRDTEDDGEGETTAENDGKGEGIERRILSRGPPPLPVLGQSSGRPRPYPADDDLVPTAPSPPRHMRTRMILEETARTLKRRGNRQRQRQRQGSMGPSEATQVGNHSTDPGFSTARLGLRGGGSEDDISMLQGNNGDDHDVLDPSEDPDKTTSSDSMEASEVAGLGDIILTGTGHAPEKPTTLKSSGAISTGSPRSRSLGANDQERDNEANGSPKGRRRKSLRKSDGMGLDETGPGAGPESNRLGEEYVREPEEEEHGDQEEASESGDRHGEDGVGDAGDDDDARKSNKSRSEQGNLNQNENDEDEDGSDEFHDSKEYLSDDEDSQDNDASPPTLLVTDGDGMSLHEIAEKRAYDIELEEDQDVATLRMIKGDLQSGWQYGDSGGDGDEDVAGEESDTDTAVWPLL